MQTTSLETRYLLRVGLLGCNAVYFGELLDLPFYHELKGDIFL
jgi:hypothetical protein